MPQQTPVGHTGTGTASHASEREQHAQRNPQTAHEAWWAQRDAPVRMARTLVPLVDGRAAMLAMCAAFLTAKRSIWLADWDMHARLVMVRGHDQRAGPGGAPEQRALLERLRAAGLDDDAIALWESGQLCVEDVLGFAAQHGVDVRVLLWYPFNPGGLAHIINNPAEQRRLLEKRGVHCRLDKSSRSPFHVAQALHQKCAVVDGEVAFIGGVDLTVEWDGDFDRWDTPSHPFDADTRATDLGPAPHPWHDVHVLLTGAPAADVERNIRQRWEEAGRTLLRRMPPPLKSLAQMYLSGNRDSNERVAREEEMGALPSGAGPDVSGSAARVQVVRTIPALTYRFAPAGIHGIAQAYTLAARRAERFIYLESQYFWLENFVGVDVLRLGWQSHYMRTLITELAAAAERGVTIALVLPDHPNCGRAFTDGGIAWLRAHAPRAAAEGRLHFFCLGTSAPYQEGGARYRPIYVHAKVGIFDDCWATVGSANLNSRGMSHDAELNLAVLDADFARGLRLSLWAEHLGGLGHAHTGWPAPAALPLPKPLVAPKERGLMALVHPTDICHAPHGEADTNWVEEGSGSVEEGYSPRPDLAVLEDPLAGIALLVQRAEENLERLRRGEPLVGQLLPYLRHEEGSLRGLFVDHERGLLDPLRSEREGVYVGHPGRYT
jgi:phosphatidylserine/phosphatidylglycerophosphate/cardiolipin synthase-like enzyme